MAPLSTCLIQRNRSELVGDRPSLASYTCDSEPSTTTNIELRSPLAFEETRGRQHSNRLIHDPLADAEIVIDPFLKVFVIGDLVRVETGAVRTPRDPDQGAG
ncbi:hypothetical protein IFM46972_00295 [Aspergillus udagawae]|uniref:Uncharacterized protein n=1 Tax=Aspergillus udagawae TaxID=91492 RepID=A0A8H3N200_9EURO|nr:hypothetical protein IFM46972_00295 [Aspergillus udagawae]